MEISSTPSASAQVEAMKKAQDTQGIQAQQILKTLESVTEQSKEMTAQKTGMGSNLNITG